MALEYHNVDLKLFEEDSSAYVYGEKSLSLKAEYEDNIFKLTFLRNGHPIKVLVLKPSSFDICRVGKKSLTLYSGESDSGSQQLSASSLLLTFPSENDLTTFQRKLQDLQKNIGLISGGSLFDRRTDHWSAVQYFQFYSFLSQQQNMMQDYIRTATYQRAVLSNLQDFQNKVVLDVGAGSGILSFFAVQAGARKVYAVEASNMAEHCEQLVRSNKLAGKIIVISGKIEEVEIPEPIDILISEPMGYMLFNERMLESYIHARKFMKPAGKMYPSVATLFIAPFSDEGLYVEQQSKANFWYQQAFHGVDLSHLREAAVNEYFRQPVVDTFDIGICMSIAHCHKLNFMETKEEDLADIDIPVVFTMHTSGTVHGLAFWFDVGFLGSQREVWLSTGPTEPLTHWYQVRCLFETPLFVLEDQVVQGRVRMRSNTRQSYDVDIELTIPGTNSKVTNTLDLKNPYFRYTGVAPQPPPGTQTTSPTEAYYSKLAAQANGVVASNGSIMMNGGDGLSQHQQQPQLNISPQFMIGDYAVSQPQLMTFSAAPPSVGIMPAVGNPVQASCTTLSSPLQHSAPFSSGSMSYQ